MVIVGGSVRIGEDRLPCMVGVSFVVVVVVLQSSSVIGHCDHDVVVVDCCRVACMIVISLDIVDRLREVFFNIWL